MIDLYLQHTFIDLVQRYNEDVPLTAELWKELETRYSEPHRRYHTLDHLQHLLGQLEDVREHIGDWDTVLFTLFYHDVVYDVVRSDNEEQSADLVAERMRAIGVSEERTERVHAQIVATKRHESDDPDTQFFLDADLSVLGADPALYDRYAADVRKEYDVYPDESYVPGRIKALEQFLFMDSIYRTQPFRDRLEEQARDNLRREIAMLGR